MKKLFYGWVIVAACTTLIFMQAGILYSFGVFFKPLAADFNASRTAISGLDAFFKISNALFVIPIGWLTDKLNPQKLSMAIAFLLGLGLILTSFTNALWQTYITYGLLAAIGTSNMVVSIAIITRWFSTHRGRALGIVSAGVGLGTLIIPSVAGYLISSYSWERAYLILGIAVWLISIPASQFLKPSPQNTLVEKGGMVNNIPDVNKNLHTTKNIFRKLDVNLISAIHTRALWTLVALYFVFSFCSQMVLVHLVNHATDIGIAPIIAASMLSVVGIGSTTGRLVMGALADKIDSLINLIICGFILIISLVLLIFAREIYLFYIIAILFGFAYGGEIPQMPIIVSKYFSIKVIGILSGFILATNSIGGAIGSVFGGLVFDITHNYQIVFLAAIFAIIIALYLTFSLKKLKYENSSV